MLTFKKTNHMENKIDQAIEIFGTEKVEAAREAVSMTDIDSALSVFGEAGMPEYQEVVRFIYLGLEN